MLIRFRATHTSTFHSNGFGFYCFRSQYLYSTTSSHFLVKYLVDSLGFSKQEAAFTSSKVTSLKSLNNPILVLNFFKQTGLDNTQMKKLVSRVPKLLLRDVSKTLKPKFQCLIDLGLSGSDLVNVIAKDSQIIERGLDNHLRPIIACLRRTLGSDENVLKAIKRVPWLLTFGAYHIIETNVLSLKYCGVPDDEIKKLVLKNPGYFAQNSEWIKGLLHRVENDFAQKNSTLDTKIRIFKGFGWSDNEILEMFRKFPHCVSPSEVKIQKVLNVYMKELGCEPAYLASQPSMLIYSMEKRVVPRMQVLKILDEKKLERRKLALYTVVSLSETKFIDYFVLPYKDQIPHLYEPLEKTVAS